MATEQAQDVGNNLTIFTKQVGAKATYSAVWSVEEHRALEVTLDLSNSQNIKIVEPTIEGMSVKVAMRGGTRTFLCKTEPADPTQSSAVQLGLMCSDLPDDAVTESGSIEVASDSPSFNPETFEFCEETVNRKECQKGVFILKQQTDGAIIFGVENKKRCAIDFAIDFSDSTNLSMTYPKEGVAGKVQERVDSKAFKLLARVMPSGQGACQVKSNIHVDEVNTKGESKFKANPRGAKVGGKGGKETKTDTSSGNTQSQATQRSFDTNKAAPALEAPPIDDGNSNSDTPQLPKGSSSREENAKGDKKKVMVVIEDISEPGLGEIKASIGDEVYIQGHDVDGMTMVIHTQTHELGNIPTNSLASAHSTSGKIALENSKLIKVHNQETGLLNEHNYDESRTKRVAPTLQQEAGSKHEGHWNAAKGVFDEKEGRLANQHAVDFLHGAMKGSDQYVPVTDDVHSMNTALNEGSAALPLPTGYLKTSDEAQGARGAGFGLDAELAAQRAAAMGASGPREAQQWIEAVTGEKFSVDGDWHASLKDGIILCNLINTIVPGSISKRDINKSKMAFKQMENISNFLKAIRKLGVHEGDLFETVDLFEGKDIGLVVRAVYSLGSTVQDKVPSFAGPHLGVKHSQINKRIWTKDQMKKNAVKYGATTKLAEGSHGIMERSHVDKTNDIYFGNVSAGGAGSAEVSQTSKGSSDVMQRGHIDQTNNITFGNAVAGSGITGGKTTSSKD